MTPREFSRRSQAEKNEEVRIKGELVHCIYRYNSVSRSMDLRFEIEARNQSVPFNRASLSFDAISFNIDNFIPLLPLSVLPDLRAYKAFRRKFATNLYKDETVVISLTKKFDKRAQISHTVIEEKISTNIGFVSHKEFQIERRIFIKCHCAVIIDGEISIRFKYHVIVIDKKISININFEVSTYFSSLLSAWNK